MKVCVGLKATLCTILLCSVPFKSFATRLGYSSQITGLDIGKGIVGVNYQDPKPPCVSGIVGPIPRSTSSLSVSVVYNSSQLAEALHIDTKAEVSILSIGSGGGHFDVAQDFADRNRAYDVVIEAWQDVDSSSYTIQPEWIPKYKAYMNAHKYDLVRRDCGDRYVSSVYNGARIFAIIHVENSAQQFHVNVNTGGSGQFNIGIVGASASLGVDADVKSAHQHGAINVISTSEGLGGIKDLAGFIDIASGDDLNDVSNKVRKALTNVQVKGQAVAYELTPLPDLPLRSLADDSVDYHLGQIKITYNLLSEMLNNANCLLMACDARGSRLKKADVAELKTYKRTLEHSVDALGSRFGICAAAYSLNDAACTSAIPTPPAPPTIAVLSVELPPVFEGVTILINKSRILTSTEVTAVFRLINDYASTADSGTLIKAARTLYPDAKTVDVFGLINSPYFSLMSTLPLSIDYSPFPSLPHTDEIVVLSSKTLKFDPSWTIPATIKQNSFPVTLLHADENNACSIKNEKDAVAVSMLIGFDGSCVAPIAKQLFAAIKVAAESAARGTCFSFPSSVGIPGDGDRRFRAIVIAIPG